MRRRDEHKQKIIKMAEERKEVGPLEDGFYYFFPSHPGGMQAHDLRVIADYLDEKNAPLEKELEEYFAKQEKVAQQYDEELPW